MRALNHKILNKHLLPDVDNTLLIYLIGSFLFELEYSIQKFILWIIL